MEGKVPPAAVAQSDLVIQNNLLLQGGYQTERKSSFVLLMVIFGQALCIAFLIWLAFFHFPTTEFAPTSNAAAVCNIAPVKEPFIHQQTVADFAVDAAIGIYTYDHVNYLKQVKAISDKYFTPEYRDQYMVAFGDSLNLQTVKENFYIVSATKGGQPPIIIKSGPVKGVYTWKIQVPLVVSYVSGRKSDTDQIIATVDVSRVTPNPLNPRGIAVSSIQTAHRRN